MSTHAVADERNVDPIVRAIFDAGIVTASVAWANGTLTLTFDPPLTAPQQAIVDELVSAGDAAVRLTREEFAAIRVHLQTLRAIRQAGRNAYVNQTEGDRNRQTYDALDALLSILLGVLRD